MVNISLKNDVVIFDIRGLDKLWSLKSSLEIPVAHITDVYADPEPAANWLDFRIGTYIPYIIRAGTFFQHDGCVFWDVHNAENCIVVELANEDFAKLVIEVSDPEAAVKMLRDAIYSR